MSRPTAAKTEPQQNPLEICWFDSTWIPILDSTNVLDYFSRATAFYDRQCNNEIVKMQRQNLDVLKNMTGIEYILLHVKEPILYVIRRQHRHSPEEATPISNYYIIAGKIYQAPDLASIFNSRILGTVHNLQQAFDEAISFTKFHPAKGYSWDFSGRGGKLNIFGIFILKFHVKSQFQMKKNQLQRRKINSQVVLYFNVKELICY
jgi:mediator of RNA polymerase II transcription subunit 6